MMEDIKWDGKPINKAGLYVGVPMEVYHSQAICAGPSVSSTGLRRVLEENQGSPAHFWCEWSGNPDYIEAEETDALVIGRAAHLLMLGGPFFKSEFIVRPDELPNYKTGELRRWYGNNTE